MLADFYTTDTDNIKQNHMRNKSRFVEGKHYFKIIGEDLRSFVSDLKSLTNSTIQLSPKTRNLILWTERGAARHAKMLETDQAWDIFEKLEDSYFNQYEMIKQHEAIPNQEYNLHLLEKDLTAKIMQVYNGLIAEIERFGGNLPLIPEFNREIFCQAYMTHLLTNRRVRMVVDFRGTPEVSLIPSQSWIIDSENIMHVIGDRDGVQKELLPGIIKAAASRLE